MFDDLDQGMDTPPLTPPHKVEDLREENIDKTANMNDDSNNKEEIEIKPKIPELMASNSSKSRPNQTPVKISPSPSKMDDSNHASINLEVTSPAKKKRGRPKKHCPDYTEEYSRRTKRTRPMRKWSPESRYFLILT